MKPDFTSFTCGTARRAFTLIELLVVLAILGILMALVTPMISSVVEGNNLSRASHLLADQIRLARQYATAENQTVEVRLIRGESAASGGYSVIQLWTAAQLQQSGTVGGMHAVGRAIALPQSVVISGGTGTLSPLLASVTTGTLPDGGTYPKALYAPIQIRPSGVVIPTLKMSSLYVTLVPSRYGAEDILPPNYAIVQINSNTGTPLVYRP